MPDQKRSLRILIVSPYFFPENFRINDVATDLVAKGHSVSVLTGQPDYPNPSLFAEFRKQKRTEQLWRGVKIHRIPTFSRGQGGKFRRLFNYTSFVVMGLHWMMTKLEHARYDIVLTWASSPITSALPSIYLRKKENIRHAIWVQDMWPETLVALKIIKSPFLIKILEVLVKFIYKRADLIWVQSVGFQNSISNKLHNKDRVKVLYNWGDETELSKDRIELKNDPRMKILYAGNIGHAQNIEAILDTIERMKNEKILWTFIGGGVLESWLRQEVKMRKLEECVRIRERVAPGVVTQLGAWADILLVSLKSNGCLKLTIPSKLQTYMTWGKPILGFIDGDPAEEIKKAECGLTASPDRPDLFEQIIRQFQTMSVAQKQTYGENARDYANRHFSRRQILDTLEEDLLSLDT